MSSRLAAEALCAVTGIWPKEPPQITTLLAAEGLIERWRGRIRQWLKKPQCPMKWEPPPEKPEKLEALLLAPLDEDETAGWLTALGDMEIGLDYVAVIKSAREYLEKQWPRFEVGNVVPESLPLSQDDYFEVWSLVRVVDQPETILDELCSYTVSPTQVAAWTACYPELSAVVLQAMNTEMAEHVVKTPLTWQQEDLVRIMRNLPPEAQIVVPGASQGPSVTSGGGKDDWKIDFRATRAPSERLLDKGSR